ncbi:hypothetical protein Droror1_Dr00023283 [Drosera rotundifolia]
MPILLIQTCHPLSSPHASSSPSPCTQPCGLILLSSFNASTASTAASQPPRPPPPPAEMFSKPPHRSYHLLIPPQASWLVDLPITLISTTLLSLFSPFLSSPTPHHHHHRCHRPPHPSTIAKRIGFGLRGSLYVAAVLMVAMAVATAVGVGLVRVMVEEPLHVRERLWFDYSEERSEAVVRVEGRRGRKGRGFGVGERVWAEVVLVVPESEFNRDIGVFQLAADALTSKGETIAKSSQPCMLLFRSRPIRLIRTFLMGVPLLLGITQETQTITINVLCYKETRNMRTDAIRVTLMPRAGTPHLPQLYHAEIVFCSQLPRMKELVYKWKYTLYVWSSIYSCITIISVLLYRYRSLVFPTMTTPISGVREVVIREVKEPVAEREKEYSETLRRCQQYRKKRKAALLSRSFEETVGSSACSCTITTVEEEVGDSESVCL